MTHPLTNRYQDTFVHLRVHSAYSLSEGALKIPDLVALAKAEHMPAVGISDTSNMFGALEFSLECARAKIQPIIATELKIKVDSLPDNAWRLPSIVLIAQNDTGYRHLIKLVSRMYLELPERGTPHITIKDLSGGMDGLILLSGGAEGPVGRLILENKKEEARALTQHLAAYFPSRFYMEIQRHGVDVEVKTESTFLEWAYEMGLPLVATNNCYFKDESYYKAHDALLCISEGTYVSDPARRRVTPHHSFKSTAQMKELFRDIPEAINNTVLIAQRCAFMLKESPPLLPRYESTSGLSEPEELRLQAQAGLKKRLEWLKSSSMPDYVVDEKIYHDRLAYELDIICQVGFAGYFLIVADFIKWAKKQSIPVGPGRGSGAGSLVAWSLTITDIDPMRYHLFFERFLNPERVSMPDFDIDFCQDRRGEVIQYVQERFGADRVAQIITFGKLQARAVLRDVGRVLQMPYAQVDRICKLIPFNPAHPCTLEEAIEQEPQLQTMIDKDITVAELMTIGKQLEGLYRHASTHAAGIIIGDRPLEEVVPLYRDPKSDILATQFSMKYVEAAGLIKFDFLGLKTLTILSKASEMVRQSGHDFILESIPLDDTKTFAYLHKGETMGIFQLESHGVREVLKKLKPNRFEELMDLNALYRPGPMDGIPTYIACKHGEQKASYLHPSLESILKVTYGVMVYQEHVMQIAQSLGGYTLGRADILRKAMGKKIKSEMDAQRKIFQQGAIKNGVDATTASLIFDQMAKFAGYGFPKPHAAAYALIMYQTAYMKTNFPHEFMAATFTYEMNNTDKLGQYCQEVRHQLGIKILPPDINASECVFSVEQHEGQKAIRYGLAAIKNVGEGAMDVVVAERCRGGPFKSMEDFISRVPGSSINKRQLESLIKAGAFDRLHPHRRQLYDGIEVILKEIAARKSTVKGGDQKGLFSDPGGSSVSELPWPACPLWNAVETVQNEYEALGFYLTGHPLDTIELSDHLQKRITRSGRIDPVSSGSYVMVGLPTAFKKINSKTGKTLGFLTLSDWDGSYEVMLFQEKIETARQAVEAGEPLLLYVGAKTDEKRGLRLMVTDMKPLSSKSSEPKRAGVYWLYAEGVDSNTYASIHALLKKREGGSDRVNLVVRLDENNSITLRLEGGYALEENDCSELKTYGRLELAPPS